MNRLVHAVAGSRKTQSIIDYCASERSLSEEGRMTLVVTYTLSAQADVERRLRAACTGRLPTVMGWYSFLLHHWVKPYLPMTEFKLRVAGLNFKGLSGEEPNDTGERRRSKRESRIDYSTGKDRFFDRNNRVRVEYLSKLALEVMTKSAGRVIDRLESIYSTIYIDEVQDLTGFDLEILEQLLKSKIEVELIGDVRQSLYSTNHRDQKNRKFRGLGKLDWFREQEKNGRLAMTQSSVTWRCIQEIADFSDTIFRGNLDFEDTRSMQTKTSEHDGVYALAPSSVTDYIDRFRPVCLRVSEHTRVPASVEARTFGTCKGLTYERVLIFPTDNIRRFLIAGKELDGKSAFGLYVATTRAIFSVAFVLPDPMRSRLRIWPGAQQGSLFDL